MNTRAIFRCALLLASLCLINRVDAIITTLSKSDPTPPYTADNPFALLGTTHYEYLKGRKKLDEHQHMSVEIMPFYQRATRGGDACGCDTQLGDISGRWNMIALLPYNKATTVTTSSAWCCPIDYESTNVDLPCGKIYPQILINIRNQLLTDIQDLVAPEQPLKLPEQLQTVQGLLDLQHSNTTLANNFGYFSVPMKYKKRGIRFNAQFYVGRGIGATVQTGFADIQQCAHFNDMTWTTSSRYGNPFNQYTSDRKGEHYYTVKTETWREIVRTVSRDLMAQLDAIASSTELCYDICNYRATSVEDLHGELFWRYPTQINKDDNENDYPKFLFIPFLALGGTYAISKYKNPCQLVSAQFGNNGHSAVRIRGGLTFDFYDSIQLSFEAGATAFRSHACCEYPVPTNPYQYPMYPFKTSICVHPGSNWHAALGMFAQNFWYNWTASFTYVYVSHNQDCITLLDNATAAEGQYWDFNADKYKNKPGCRGNIHPFSTNSLMCISPWSVQVFNASLGYVIAPSFTLNFMMQIPVKRKNCYRSSTFMGSLYLSI